MSANATLRINLQNLSENWKVLSKLSGTAKASAVVKANAYGLGAERIASTLSRIGCDTFFVATAHEGSVVRSVAPFARILVLLGLQPGTEVTLQKDRLIPVISNRHQHSLLLASGLNMEFAVHVDTGMNRLGFDMEDIGSVLADRGSRPSTVISHLACGDDPSNEMNGRQLRRFQELKSNFPAFCYSLANSAGIFLGDEFCFDLTRPGIAIYGGGSDFTLGKISPVVELRAKVLQIRSANAGETVSYGAAHVLRRSSRLAVAGIGYADGLHRALSGDGVAARQDRSPGLSAICQGQRIPVVGRITMDMTVFDITDLTGHDLREGDDLDIILDGASLSAAAAAAGTIDYEILTGLGVRLERTYVS
jgi:alanine racemase